MKSADGSPDEESMTKSPGDGVIYHSGFDPDVMQVFFISWFHQLLYDLVFQKIQNLHFPRQRSDDHLERREDGRKAGSTPQKTHAPLGFWSTESGVMDTRNLLIVFTVASPMCSREG